MIGMSWAGRVESRQAGQRDLKGGSRADLPGTESGTSRVESGQKESAVEAHITEDKPTVSV